MEIFEIFEFASTDSVNGVENVVKCIFNRWEILCGNLAAAYPTFLVGV